MKKLINAALIVMLTVTVGCWSSSGGGGGDDPVFVPTPSTPAEPTPDVTPKPDNDDDLDDQDYTPQDPTDPVYDIDLLIPAPHADYNKNFQNDTMMCWAVATCNALTNAGYAFSAASCMYEMIERFDDVPGYPADAVNYWFQLKGYSYVPAWQELSDPAQIDFITDELELGLPVIISMGSTIGNVGHALTVYGYTFVANSDGPPMYVLRVVDGDDQYDGIVQWGFYWNASNSRWECYDRDFYLASSISIDTIRAAGRRTTTIEYAPIERGSQKVGG